MSKTVERYAFEAAKAKLDEFAQGPIVRNNTGFRRAYRKFLGLLTMAAVVDYRQFTEDSQQALAWAWEDADISFRGYGDAFLTGAVVHLWNAVDRSSKEATAFHAALQAALTAAETQTKSSAPRRYSKVDRSKPIRTLSDGFNLPYVLPTWGPTLERWAEEEGLDYASMCVVLQQIEESERVTTPATPSTSAPVNPRTARSRAHLTLIQGGPDDE